ncbi:hypothetical protein SeLEV6574_g00965 [Synchytrium endobioticum]|nr:hypothetical protein SeLEV6574_g00965 [Synchytrium endobioticum]
MNHFVDLLQRLYTDIAQRPILCVITYLFCARIVCGQISAPTLSARKLKTLTSNDGSRFIEIHPVKQAHVDADNAFPLVVFECELGMNSSEWGAAHTERDALRDAAVLAHELHSLLAKSDVIADETGDKRKNRLKRPFVIVGHSYGGLIASLLAQAYAA